MLYESFQRAHTSKNKLHATNYLSVHRLEFCNIASIYNCSAGIVVNVARQLSTTDERDELLPISSHEYVMLQGNAQKSKSRLHNGKKDQSSCSRTENIIFFILCILLLCQNLEPTFPTMQLHHGWKFVCIMQLMWPEAEMRSGLLRSGKLTSFFSLWL